MNYTEHKKEDYIIWLKAGCVISAWVDKGRITFPIELLSSFNIEKAFEFMKAHKYYCSNCAIKLKENQIKHSHFAGIYCEKCAKEYKEKNKRVCTLCRKPEHTCYC